MYIFNKIIKTLVLFLLLNNLALYGQSGTGPTTLQIKNEEQVNSKGLEFSPTFYEDGIVFISTNSAGLKKTTDDNLKLQTMTILHSRRDAEGQLGLPEAFAKELSTKFNEGPVCFDSKTEKVFYSSNNNKNGREVRGKDGKTYMKLYFSQSPFFAAMTA